MKRDIRESGQMYDFIALTKPRLVTMLVLTTCVGFHLGATETVNGWLLLHTLLGTGLSAGGMLALNQFLERDHDAIMRRTMKRPLPSGRLQPGEALIFGVLITAAGLLYLGLVVNILSGVVTAVITIVYLFMYTPLKQRTSLSTVVGAIPGGLPPVTGWVAARGEIGIEAAVLFTIMFFWQIPHALSLAWQFRDDYARAGFQLLPVLYPDGRVTSVQILINCLALIVVSLMPSLIGLTGKVYFFVSCIGGLIFLGFALHLARTRSLMAARYLFLVSLVYLFAQFMTMALDKV